MYSGTCLGRPFCKTTMPGVTWKKVNFDSTGPADPEMYVLQCLDLPEQSVDFSGYVITSPAAYPIIAAQNLSHQAS